MLSNNFEKKNDKRDEIFFINNKNSLRECCLYEAVK